MAIGPDVRTQATSAVPTSNADLAPTLLRLLGLRVPRRMTGRPIEDGLVKGPHPARVPATHTSETARTADGSYEVTVHLSTAAGRTYVDFTETVRSPKANR